MKKITNTANYTLPEPRELWSGEVDYKPARVVLEYVWHSQDIIFVDDDKWHKKDDAEKEKEMNYPDEKLMERRIRYTLEHEGKFYIVENVPARVNEETGEQFFSPATVEHLQKTIVGNSKPSKVIETPVYYYSA